MKNTMLWLVLFGVVFITADADLVDLNSPRSWIQLLESSMNDSSVMMGNILTSMATRLETLELKLESQNTELDNCKKKQSQLQQTLDTLQTKTSSLQTTQTKVANRVGTLEKKPESWPAGRYCILANGNCPAGFVKYDGWIRAIRTYTHSNAYVGAANFGSSRISCHGPCGKYPPHNADIQIVSCCK